MGCGKSTTIRLLAAELGYQIVEYTPPAPTLWSELQHQVSLHDAHNVKELITTSCMMHSKVTRKHTSFSLFVPSNSSAKLSYFFSVPPSFDFNHC